MKSKIRCSQKLCHMLSMYCLQAYTDWLVKISSLNTGMQQTKRLSCNIQINDLVKKPYCVVHHALKHFKNPRCVASMAEWLLQTHPGSLVVGDLNSVRNIRTCGSRVKTIQESEAPVSA